MKNTIIILLITLASSVGLFAQENITCPKVEILGPPSTVALGESMTFSVVLDDEALKLDLTYEWETDKGKILEGQGTNQIRVGTDGLETGTLIAKVNIKGLPEECKNEFKESGIVLEIQCHFPKDDFGKIKKKDIRARIDAFIADLQNNPDSIGVIVQYGKAKVVRKREKIIRKQFKFRGFDLGKITFLYKDVEKEIKTKLIRVPEGVDTSKLY